MITISLPWWGWVLILLWLTYNANNLLVLFGKYHFLKAKYTRTAHMLRMKGDVHTADRIEERIKHIQTKRWVWQLFIRDY